jgi:plasmid stability protein
MLGACDHVRSMKMIQIRNVPDDLHRELKARAAREGVTLSQLILRELPHVAHRPSQEEVLARILSREPVPGPSGAELVRQGREEREAELDARWADRDEEH